MWMSTRRAPSILVSNQRSRSLCACGLVFRAHCPPFNAARPPSCNSSGRQLLSWRTTGVRQTVRLLPVVCFSGASAAKRRSLVSPAKSLKSGAPERIRTTDGHSAAMGLPGGGALREWLRKFAGALDEKLRRRIDGASLQCRNTNRIRSDGKFKRQTSYAQALAVQA